MADIQAKPIRTSESRSLSVTITPVSGTLTLASATVTLYDAGGNVAGGVEGATAAFDAGAQAAPKAWYTVAPRVLGIALGHYTLAFLVTDANGAIREPVVGFEVLADSS